MEERRTSPLTRSSTRRTALGHGALLATLGAISVHQRAAGQATPGVGVGGGVLLAQSFAQGSLFPTQGDVGVLPYTAILWDAADRGFLVLDPTGGSAGMASTEAVLSALAATEEPPAAVLLTLSADEGATGGIWALQLVSGELGSDPGAVTYQGEPLSDDDVPSWLGTAPPKLPDASLELGAGYLVIARLSGL